MKPGLSERERARTIADDPRRRCAMPQWRLTNGKGDYVVTGAPVVVDDLSDAISRSLVLLLRRRAAGDGAHARARVPRRACACCRWWSPWPRWR